MKYKLVVAARARPDEALAELDRQVQELYAEGYREIRKVHLYLALTGGLHVAYKELECYEDSDRREHSDWYDTLTAATAEADHVA